MYRLLLAIVNADEVCPPFTENGCPLEDVKQVVMAELWSAPENIYRRSKGYRRPGSYQGCMAFSMLTDAILLDSCLL